MGDAPAVPVRRHSDQTAHDAVPGVGAPVSRRARRSIGVARSLPSGWSGRNRAGKMMRMTSATIGDRVPAGAPAVGTDHHRILLPAVLAAPLVLFVALTPIEPYRLYGGLLARGTPPGYAAVAVVILASVSSVLGLLICRWRPGWGLALSLWPFGLIVVMGTFVWAWLPALIGVAVVLAVDDWRRAIPAWVASVVAGLVYCFSGVDALILGQSVTIRLRTTTSFSPDIEQQVDVSIAATYVALYVLAPTVTVVLAAAIGMTRRARIERRGAASTLREALQTESVASERARVARDLHDVVAHHVSLVAVRAESAPFVHPGLDAVARDVLEQIAGDARHALDELRHVLTVLDRAGGDTTMRAPQPGVADIATLVSDANTAGQRVTVRGDWSGAVPDTVGYVLYRVVQEALSNARRHAPGSAVAVTAWSDADSARVRVANPVDGRHRPEPPGRGLIGMRERVTVLGGTLETGRMGEDFVVMATIPLSRRDDAV